MFDDNFEQNFNNAVADAQRVTKGRVHEVELDAELTALEAELAQKVLGGYLRDLNYSTPAEVFGAAVGMANSRDHDDIERCYRYLAGFITDGFDAAYSMDH